MWNSKKSWLKFLPSRIVSWHISWSSIKHLVGNKMWIRTLYSLRVNSTHYCHCFLGSHPSGTKNADGLSIPRAAGWWCEDFAPQWEGGASAERPCDAKSEWLHNSVCAKENMRVITSRGKRKGEPKNKNELKDQKWLGRVMTQDESRGWGPSWRFEFCSWVLCDHGWGA